MDLRYIPEKLEASWNFINKIWNSARFVLMNIDGDLEYKDLKFDHLNLCDKWILNRLNNVIDSSCFATESTQNTRIANVTVLTPPAVPVGDPPMIIRNIETSEDASVNAPCATVSNPAVRVVTD